MELYLVRMHHANEAEEFYKVGVSENSKTRFSYGTVKVIDSDLPFHEKLKLHMNGQEYLPDHPYEVDHLHTVYFKFPGEAFTRERALLNTLKDLQYRPRHRFSGHTECFRCEDEVKALIIESMDAAEREGREAEPNALRYRLAEAQIGNCDDPVELHRRVLEEIDRRLRQESSNGD